MKEWSPEQQIAADFTEGLRTRSISVACGSWLAARTLQVHAGVERYLPPHTPDLAHIVEFGYASGAVGAVTMAASFVKKEGIARYPERLVALTCGLGTLATNIAVRIALHADLSHTATIAGATLATTGYLMPHYREMRLAQRILHRTSGQDG